MNLAEIAWKSIRSRSLSSSLTALSIALGVTMMVAVLVIYGVIESTFSQNSINYDLIVGPKGSPLQLVLSTVYHVNPPIENLPYSYYETLKNEPGVSAAMPIAIGDTTEEGGFPIVGTIPEYFTIDYAPANAKRPARAFRVDGRFIRGQWEAVVGSHVANANGWTVGTQFRMVHSGADDHVHDEKFTVVGILAPTGMPFDKTVFVHLEGYYGISGHDKPLPEAIAREREFFGLEPFTPEQMAAEIKRLKRKYHIHEHKPGETHHDHVHETPPVQKEVTSVLLQFKTPQAALLFEGRMKKGFRAMAVNPVRPMRQLLSDILGPVKLMLLALTALIILVSAVGVFVSIYNSMAERRREIAIMRALGASRATVMLVILAESTLLCLGGGLLGLLLGHGLVYVTSPMVEARTGLLMNPFAFEQLELALLPVLIVLASIAGLIPAISAYRTDVASNLAG